VLAALCSGLRPKTELAQGAGEASDDDSIQGLDWGFADGTKACKTNRVVCGVCGSRKSGFDWFSWLDSSYRRFD
jgi:hypothetical protein